MLAETGLCQHSEHGGEITQKCPRSCGACPGQKATAKAAAMAPQQPQAAAADAPPAGTCVDANTTGFDLKGAPAPCSMLAETGLCAHAEHGPEIRQKCPLSCSVCSATSTGAGSAAGPDDGDAVHCEDAEVTGYDLQGAPAPCSMLAEKGLCEHAEHGPEIMQKCSKSCGICSSQATTPQVPQPPATTNSVGGRCVDVEDTKLDLGGSPATCPTLAQAGMCNHPTHSADVKQKCPLSCGLCRGLPQQQGPTTVADGCADREPTGFEIKGAPASCDQIVANGLCNHPSLGDSIKEACPASCGVCSAAPVSEACTDADVTGFDLKGAPATCAQLAQTGLCSHPTHAAEIRKTCPLSCGTCGEGQQQQQQTPPGAVGGCVDADVTGLDLKGAPATCTQLAQLGLCNTPAYAAEILKKCPLSCGLCGGQQQVPPLQEQQPQQPAPPGCADQAATGFDLKGQPAPCSMLLEYGLCTHAEHGPSIKQACPVSCDACDMFVPPATAAATPASAIPAVPATPTIETEMCIDVEFTGLDIDGGPASCQQLFLKDFCTHAEFGAAILRKCPVACGVCTAEQAAEAAASTEAAAASKTEDAVAKAAEAAALAADISREYVGRASVIEKARSELATALTGLPCSAVTEFHLCTLVPATCAWDLASEACRDRACLDITGEAECVGSGCEYVAEVYACRRAGEELPCSVFWDADNCPADRCHYIESECRGAGAERPCSSFWEADACPVDRCHYTDACVDGPF